MMKAAVLLAAFNGSRFIKEQLSSLMSQTYTDLTVYVHDDGSTDDTLDIVNEYAANYPGRIEIIEGPPSGSAKDNFWFLLKQVEADVYLFCDQDDVWLDDKAAREIERLKELPASSCRCVFCDMKVVDEKLKVIDESFLHYNGRDPGDLRYQRILIDNPAAGTSMCFDRALRDRAVAWDFDLKGIEMHDGFLLAMAALCGKVSYIDTPLVLYRQHSSNEMGAARSESVFERIKRNISDLLSGRMLENKRRFISLSRKAAYELSRMKDIPEADRRVLYRYARLFAYPKPSRIAFLKKNGFNRARHTWWMWLWS